MNYGVKTMSMGYLVPQEAPVAWRGMMVVKALQQLLHEVDWGGLDTLVLDLPPGTGDTQLTIAQQVELDGEVLAYTIFRDRTNAACLCRGSHRIYASRCRTERYLERHLDVSEDERAGMCSIRFSLPFGSLHS